MRAADTNVLVRLVARDDLRQTETAEAFVTKGVWISHLVLAETTWVLERVYDLTASDIARTIEMLLHHKAISIQDADAVVAALDHYRRRPSLGFSDCLMLEIARKAGHLPLGTFDKSLGKLDGTEYL